ncbi:MAG: TOBE domain-containing protein [Methanobacteriaceae archaeon]|nr:TOBE domain-containing protein [Methanobacteriaceae archaeon]
MTRIRNFPEYRLEIDDKPILIDEKKFNLLRYIEKYGSIMKASAQSKVSYRTALKYLELMEYTLKSPVVSTTRGGKGGGGGSKITNTGKLVIKEYIKLEQILKKHTDVNEIEGIVCDVDESNLLMSVDLGGKRIIFPLIEKFKIGDEVLILISPEDIFIMLEPQNSSVRNIMAGIIIGMKLQNEMIRLEIALDENITIRSYITKLSRDKLGLDLGKSIYIGFKATSISVIKI